MCRSGCPLSIDVLYELSQTLEKARQSVVDGPIVTGPMQRVHCVAMALKTSMDSHEDATACYELKMPVMCPTRAL